MKFVTCLVVVLAVVVSGVHGYPKYPPTDTNKEICSGTMEPQHGATAQTKPSPFKVVVSNTCYKASRKVSVSVVKVDSSSSHYFEGFLLLARSKATTETAVGKFSIENDEKLKLLNCFTGTNNAIGHNTKAHYASKTFFWTAPEDLVDEVTFQATIVHEKDEYWLNVKSSKITFNASCAEDVVTTPAPEPPATTTAASNAIPLYACLASVVAAIGVLVAVAR